MNGISTSVYLTKESIEKINNVKGTGKMSTMINTLFTNMSEEHLKSLIEKTPLDRDPKTIKDISIHECNNSKKDVQSIIKELDDIQEISDNMQRVLDDMQKILQE